MENIFEDDFVETEQEESKVEKKRTFKEWLSDNAEWVVPTAIVGGCIAALKGNSRKRKKAADLEAEKQLIGQIAYQAGQKDAYRDVATRRRRKNHNHNRNN